MKKNKLSKLVMILMMVALLTGCGSNESSTTANNTNGSSNNNSNSNESTTPKSSVSESDTAGMEKLTCSREASAGSGIDVNLDYEIYYQGEYIQILHSTEQVVTDDQDTLDEYADAYKGIYKHYEGLKYYDNTVTRTNDSVTSDTVINYGKIDTDKLLAIEGEEDNVIKDGKVKLEDWLDFAEQFGTKCE